jgi:hypothetical protein
MPITNTPVLTEANKTWITNNSSKFTAREIADYFGVYPKLIHSFCRSKKLELKSSDGNHEQMEGIYFNADHYRDNTATI